MIKRYFEFQEKGASVIPEYLSERLRAQSGYDISQTGQIDTLKPVNEEDSVDYKRKKTITNDCVQILLNQYLTFIKLNL